MCNIEKFNELLENVKDRVTDNTFKYYYISDEGDILYTYWLESIPDLSRKQWGNIFFTEKEAYMELQNIKERRRYATTR